MTGITAPSRRGFLRGATLGAAALALPRRAWATDAVLPVGGIELRVVSDGDRTMPLDFLLGDVPDDEIAALYAEAGEPVPADVPTPNNVVLIRSGERRILIDAGSGPNFAPTTGRLENALRAAGVDPDDITDVIFTHAHPDHLWGALDDFEEFARFPNARYVIAEDEFAHWIGPAPAGAPAWREGMALGAARTFEALGDQLEQVGASADLAPGVSFLPTPGHTPGHMSIRVSDGAEQLILLGDALTSPVFSFHRPGWPVETDSDRDLGAETRLRLLDEFATDRLAFIGFHLPFPGLGRAERQGEGYRFMPI